MSVPQTPTCFVKIGSIRIRRHGVNLHRGCWFFRPTKGTQGGSTITSKTRHSCHPPTTRWRSNHSVDHPRTDVVAVCPGDDGKLEWVDGAGLSEVDGLVRSSDHDGGDGVETVWKRCGNGPAQLCICRTALWHQWFSIVWLDFSVTGRPTGQSQTAETGRHVWSCPV